MVVAARGVVYGLAITYRKPFNGNSRPEGKPRQSAFGSYAQFLSPKVVVPKIYPQRFTQIQLAVKNKVAKQFVGNIFFFFGILPGVNNLLLLQGGVVVAYVPGI